MAHELLKNDTMVSANGIVPWHGLGTVVEGAMNVDDVLKLGGIDWEVERVPVFAEARGGRHEAPNHRGIVRVDTGDVLSVMSADYVPVQNAEGLAFLQALMDNGDIAVETAGSLRGNRVVFITARIDKDVTVAGDKIVPYIVFSNSHDGTMAVTTTAGPVRVVCANTLKMSDVRAAAQWRMRHVGDVNRRIGEARDALGMTFRYYDAFEKEAAALYAQGVTDRQFHNVLKELVPVPDEAGRKRNNAVEVQSKIDLRWMQEPARGTGWGALNAVNSFELWDTKAADAQARSARQAFNVLRGTQKLTGQAHELLVARR